MSRDEGADERDREISHPSASHSIRVRYPGEYEFGFALLRQRIKRDQREPIVQSPCRKNVEKIKKKKNSAETHRVTSYGPTCQFNANFGAANREIGFSKLFQPAIPSGARVKSALNQA